MSNYSCSLIKKQLCSSEKDRIRYMEYVLNDSTICYMSELKIKSKKVGVFLDSVLVLFDECKHCIEEINIPEYFVVFGKRTHNENQLYIVHSYWTEEIQVRSNDYFGGLYYKNKLFIIHESILSINSSLFEETGCDLRIERCNLRTVGGCFNATFSLGKEEIMKYNCNDPFPFIR
jgi:hypothetical protein